MHVQGEDCSVMEDPLPTAPVFSFTLYVCVYAHICVYLCVSRITFSQAAKYTCYQGPVHESNGTSDSKCLIARQWIYNYMSFSLLMTWKTHNDARVICTLLFLFAFWQLAKQAILDLPLPNNIFQLLLGDPEVIPDQI